jgi:cytochrome oxidase assembly protein ShyY1
MALAGRLATVFSGASPDRRGIYAVLLLMLLLIIIVVSVGTWGFR